MTDRLYERLGSEEQTEVAARLTNEERSVWQTADEVTRKRLTLAFGVHHGVAGVMQQTGLVQASPPEDVHAMVRSPLAAGGDYYYADLVAGSFIRARAADLDVSERGLDFGCSSGRVVRALAAAYPGVEWHGCDPIEDAITWAAANLPQIQFALSPQEPELPYEAAAFDRAFAISIWSHFAPGAAVRWLDELWRVIRPGGYLLLTTHGWQAINYYARTEIRSTGQLTDIARSLYSEGFWYAPEFGERGDHGIRNPEWGTAFMTAEWLLEHSLARWRLAWFASGIVQANQDLYVLERMKG